MENSAGRLESINTSRGGVPKTSVVEARITEHGVEGDAQKLPLVHGGRNRAVSLYSLDLIHALQAEGHPIEAGTVGENLTISGVDWSQLAPGRELQIGAVRLAATGYASPCLQIRRSFVDGKYERISHKTHPGWSRVYTRVVVGGIVRTGDPVLLLP